MANSQLFSFGSLFSFLALLLAVANAFPTAENLAKLARRSGEELSPEVLVRDLHALKAKIEARGASTEPVDVSGEHEFQAPNFAAGDQRGPCPGLNVLANHGYISRDGVTGVFDAISAASQVLGLGVDVASLLGILGTIEVGNPLSLNPGFSIGGQSSKDSNILGNLLGLLNAPGGLDTSHNLIESDASPTRNDLYMTGNAWDLDLNHLEAFLATSDSDVLTIDNANDFAMTRFQDSVSTNPYFFYGPLTGLLVRNGAFFLPPRIFANFSAEYLPDGQLTKTNYMTFYGVVEQDGEMVYTRGSERIPSNFYSRPTQYTLVNYNLDIVSLVMKYPELLSIGGNSGTVNSFEGLDMDDLTGGLLNAANLSSNNNIVCFTLEVLQTFVPRTLSGLFSVVEVPLQLLDQALAPLVDLSCPSFTNLTDFYTDMMDKYPGAKKSGYAF